MSKSLATTFKFDVSRESYRQVEERFRQQFAPDNGPFNFPRCEHSSVQLRRKQESGRVTFKYQCLECGEIARTVRKSEVPNPDALPLFDDEFQQVKREERRAEINRMFESRKNASDGLREGIDELFQRYHAAYMNSEKWHSLRQRVLKRANSLCEGCGNNRAVQVHHLTYDRLGDEMLFDLVAVCRQCHNKIHHRDGH